MADRTISAANPDTNASLQITNLPDSIINVNGGFLYVTEIFTRHQLHHAAGSAASVRRHDAEHAVFDRLFLTFDESKADARPAFPDLSKAERT